MTLSWITHLVQSYGYYAVFTLIALESMGIPLPGETALISAALYAGTTHHLNVVVLTVVATCAAIIGDNAGYWIGRTGGYRLAERYGRYVRLDRAKLKVGRYLFARHGWKVVFFGDSSPCCGPSPHSSPESAKCAGPASRGERGRRPAVGGLLHPRRIRARQRRVQRRKRDHHRRVRGRQRGDRCLDHRGAKVAAAPRTTATTPSPMSGQRARSAWHQSAAGLPSPAADVSRLLPPA